MQILATIGAIAILWIVTNTIFVGLNRAYLKWFKK